MKPQLDCLWPLAALPGSGFMFTEGQIASFVVVKTKAYSTDLVKKKKKVLIANRRKSKTH